MSAKNTSKTNPWIVVLIFVITAVVVFSTVFLILYLNSDYKEIKANKTEYYVNVGESVELDLCFTNIDSSEYEITSQDTTIATYNSVDNVVDGLSGGKVAVIITTDAIKNFTPIALTIVVCDGLTQETALMIDSREDLIAVGSTENRLTLYYRLVADIDCLDEEWVPLGFINDTTYEFSGMLSCDGYTISNIKITTPYEYSGLFAKIGETGMVHGLNLTNVNIKSETKQGASFIAIGALAGANFGTIQKVYVSNSSLINNKAVNSSAYVGGITGFNTGIVAQASFENAKVVSTKYAGGIVGANLTVSETLATVKQAGVNAQISGVGHVGGIVGLAQGSIIADSYTSNTSKVYTSSPTTLVGGIVGTLQYASVNSKIVDSMMINCYSVADLGDTGRKGALIGWNYNYSTTTLQYNKVYGSYWTDENTNASVAVSVTQNGEAQIAANKVAVADLSNSSNFISYVNDLNENVLWDFTNIWTLDQNNLPTLVKFGMVSNFDKTDLKEEGAIYSAVDLINIANNMSGNYVLKADLDLSVLATWTAIGAEDNKFMGSLIADKDPNTLEFYKIKNLKTDATNQLAGLFAYVGETAKISNIIIDGAKAVDSANVGLIATFNAGVIENCAVVNSEISVNNTIGNVSFICGSNTGTIANSYVDLSTATITGTGANVAGSIAAINYGVITSCYTLKDTKIDADTANYSVLLGGLAGVNEDSGIIRFSFSEGNFTGYNLGGIAAVNENQIFESYSNNTLTGKLVGGIAYIISYGNSNKYGVIANCYTISQINGIDKNSIKCGFAYAINYCVEGENAGKYGWIVHSFSGATFNDIGENYFETHSKVRVDSGYVFGIKGDRTAGFVVDCIFDEQGRNAIKNTTPFYVEVFDPVLMEDPIGLTTEECFNKDNFTAQGFLETIWTFNIDYYPELKNVVKAK